MSGKHTQVIISYTMIIKKTDKPDLIKFCHKLRLKVCYYNIKKTGETKRLKKIGADMLILNKPAFAD